MLSLFCCTFLYIADSRPPDELSHTHTALFCQHQGILKGKVSLYCWPPVWLVWNQLYDLWQFLFLFAKQANPNLSNRRPMVQWYFPLKYSMHNLCLVVTMSYVTIFCSDRHFMDFYRFSYFTAVKLVNLRQ